MRNLFSTLVLSFLLLSASTLPIHQVTAQDSPKKAERPTAVDVLGTPKIDGEIDDAWKVVPAVAIKKIVLSETSMVVAKKTEGGYIIEMSVRLSFAKPQEGTKMGLELQINDDPGTGSRGGITK